MMKEIKKNILFALIVISLVGCKKINTIDKALAEGKEYGTIYFVRGMVDTDLPVSCNNYLSSLDFLISYFKIDDKVFIDLLLKDWQTDDIVKSNNDLDIRYRIEFKDKVICIDNFGNYSVDSKFIGKLSNFQLLLDYIEEHRENSIKLKEDFPFEDVK
ncbi:hypothetical protein [Myroides fluvii]|uniref:hypothetical protein n=1 Tax=Myroides fluvii TaxID=2572594 RepID=UPI001E54C3E1|nr:hypothetical protein [Myroides fluvii]